MRVNTLLLVAAVSLAAAPADASRVEIILDVSGSMRARIGAETRMEAARKAIRATLAGVQPDSVVALRLYGHRAPQENKAESCRDSELTVPFQPLDKAAFLAVVDGAQPRGQTPIAYSLEQAARDFGPADDAERAIILVSDGAESCGGDPAATARDLLAQGFKVRIHTIGLDVDAAARAQLEAISTATGGEYNDARNASALAESLTRLAQRSLLIEKGTDELGLPVRGGDGYESAVEIQSGQVYRLDHHQRKGEYDYFYLDVAGAQKVQASIEAPQRGVAISGESFREDANPYAGLQLQDGSRRKLGAADIFGARGEKKTLQGSLSGGRLYVLVGSSYGAQHKDSRFQVVLASLPGDAGAAGDAGGSEREAMTIVPGDHQAFLEPNTDTIDFFKFKADPAATYAVRVRPSQPTAWLELSVADADGGVAEEARAGKQGDPVRVAGLRFPKGGDVFVRVSYYKYATGSPETDYSLDLKQEGGTAPAAAAGGAVSDQAESAAAPPSGPDGPPSFVRRVVSLFLWSGVPLLGGLLIGALGGYLLGRRRR